MQPLVGLIMGSASDWETLQHAAPQGYRSGFLFFASANDKQSVGTGVEFFEKKSTPVPLGSGTFGFLVEQARAALAKKKGDGKQPRTFRKNFADRKSVRN